MSLLMAHRCWEELWYWDNSKKSIEESLKNGFDIIEVDIRKSKDWILYCYHWNFWEVTLYNFLLKTKTFEELKKSKNIISLEEAINIIWEKSYIFLDLKEYDIKPKELEKVLINKSSKWIYLWWILTTKKLFSYKNMSKLIKNFRLVYVGFNPFFVNFKKIFDLWIDVIQIFHWHIWEKSKIFDDKISITPMFISKEKYKSKLKEHKNFHYIHTDYI
jgi:hypothetical protein